MSFQRTLAGAIAALSITFAAASADAANPCGQFDFSGGFDCKVEVKGGCTSKCQPLYFESGCTGSCNQTATTVCTDNCGTTCLKNCNPKLLDCFEGCHGECDGQVTADCNTKKGTDCANTAKAQCDIHCKQVCKVPDTSCSEHCTKCCSGSCVTQINGDCDLQCFTTLKGGCETHCAAPAGALFCNGQYVFANDIQACIDYLLTQGFTIDVRASASLKCDLSGCVGFAGVTGLPFVGKGCAASGVDPLGTGLGLGGLTAAAIAMAASTIRRRRNRPKA